MKVSDMNRPDDLAEKNLKDLKEWQALHPPYAINMEMHVAKCSLIGEPVCTGSKVPRVRC